MSEPGYVAQTLAWCNERRAEQGKKALKKLPKGKRSDNLSCPCGTATGLLVEKFRYAANELELITHPRPLPDSVKHFVRAFDHGELPQYELAASPLKEEKG